MITDIYQDPDTGSALVVCDDESVWDLWTDEHRVLHCERLALTPDGKVVHRTEAKFGDRWVTYDDLTTPTPKAGVA
jgi:hypothetical protein